MQVMPLLVCCMNEGSKHDLGRGFGIFKGFFHYTCYFELPAFDQLKFESGST
jgi:hypothetical protein